jgi:hypothetical protein
MKEDGTQRTPLLRRRVDQDADIRSAGKTRYESLFTPNCFLRGRKRRGRHQPPARLREPRIVKFIVWDESERWHQLGRDEAPRSRRGSRKLNRLFLRHHAPIDTISSHTVMRTTHCITGTLIVVKSTRTVNTMQAESFDTFQASW